MPWGEKLVKNKREKENQGQKIYRISINETKQKCSGKLFESLKQSQESSLKTCVGKNEK